MAARAAAACVRLSGLGRASSSATAFTETGRTSDSRLGSWPQAAGVTMAITVTRRTRRARSKTTGVEGGTIVGGNLLRDSLNRTYAFDAENLMTALCSSQTNPAQCTNAWTNGNVAYSYDGDGRRVQTAEANGTVTTYVYDAGGQLAAEYGGSPITICKQSSPATPGACYSVADRLGSTRVVTTDRGIPLECDDYPPVRRGGAIEHRRPVRVLPGKLGQVWSSPAKNGMRRRGWITLALGT